MHEYTTVALQGYPPVSAGQLHRGTREVSRYRPNAKFFSGDSQLLGPFYRCSGVQAGLTQKVTYLCVKSSSGYIKRRLAPIKEAQSPAASKNAESRGLPATCRRDTEKPLPLTLLVGLLGSQHASTLGSVTVRILRSQCGAMNRAGVIEPTTRYPVRTQGVNHHGKDRGKPIM